MGDGHDVGSHSWGHERPGSSRVAVFRDLVRASRAIHRAAGVRPRWFRPPYAKWSGSLVLSARLAGMRTVMWDADSRDWETEDPADLVERVLRSTTAGSIVLFHDREGLATVDALPAIIENLRIQGLETVSVPSLLRGD